MRKLSFNPDPHMAWIYDMSHPDYHSEYAQDLRERRARALATAPEWMKAEAHSNDNLSRAKK